MNLTIRALAIVLAFAALPSSAQAPDSHQSFGEHCENNVYDDVFDGPAATASCEDSDSSISIIARCMDDTTRLFVSIGKRLTDGARLLMALDGVEIQQEKWRTGFALNGGAVFLYPALPTAREILKHARLQVRIIEIDNYTHNADIDISAFGEAIKPVRELCGW